MSPDQKEESNKSGGGGDFSPSSKESSSRSTSNVRPHLPSSPTQANKSVKLSHESSPQSPSSSRTGTSRKSINGGRGSPSSSPKGVTENANRAGRRGSAGDVSGSSSKSGPNSPGPKSTGSPSTSPQLTARRKSLPKDHSMTGSINSEESHSLEVDSTSGISSAEDIQTSNNPTIPSTNLSSTSANISNEATSIDPEQIALDPNTSAGGLTTISTDDGETSGDISSSSSNSVPLSLSATLSRGAYHQCGTARRVKVYELKGETWFDRGTGYCAGVYDEHNDAALLVARMEETCRRLTLGSNGSDEQLLNRSTTDSGEDEQIGAEGREDREHYVLVVSENLDTDDLLLRARVVKDDVYQRQQDTLVVWTEPDGTDMALSFQEADGCHEVWEFLTEVQKHFLLSARGGPADGFDVEDVEGAGMIGMSAAAAAGGMTTTDDDLILADGSPFALPDPPRLNNLDLIDATLKDAASRSPQAREKVAEWVLREEYILKLIPVFHDAEELEQLDGLHRLCSIMHTIIMLNDSVLVERMLRDDTFLGAMGMLEYDPEFPRLKASYRNYLTTTARFRQVVPIPDPIILAKIHQTFRLQYLKDVILARTLDDSTFAVLNSLIFYHQADIVMFCTNSEALLSSLFQLFEPDRNESEERKAEAIIFLQQLCAIGKQVQLPSRIALYRTLTEWGLLIVLEYALSRTESRLRNAAAEILMSIIEYDANGVRGHVLEQVDKKSSAVPLVTKLAKILHEPEGDLGLKTQITESLRILFDSSLDGTTNGAMVAQTLAAASGQQAQEDGQRKDSADRFLNWFYDGEIDVLFAPLRALSDEMTSSDENDDREEEGESGKVLNGENEDDKEAQKNGKKSKESTQAHLQSLSPSESATLNHLCELLTFVMTHHQFRSQYWVISTDVGIQVASLLFAREKHLRLAALRFFRAGLAKGNQFINRHFMKIGLLGSILSVVECESSRDNLVTSACLEFFEHIRKEQIKLLINHLLEKYESRVRALTQHLTIGHYFQALILQWEKEGAEQTLPSSTTMEPSLGSFDEAERERRMRDMTRRGENRAIMDSDEENYFQEDEGEGEDEEEDEEEEGMEVDKSEKVVLPPYNSGRRRSGSGLLPYVPNENDEKMIGLPHQTKQERKPLEDDIEALTEEGEEDLNEELSVNDTSIGHQSASNISETDDASDTSASANDSIDTINRSTKRKKSQVEEDDGEELALGRVSKRQSSGTKSKEENREKNVSSTTKKMTIKFNPKATVSGISAAVASDKIQNDHDDGKNENEE